MLNRSGKSIFNMIWGITYRVTSMLFPFVIKSIIIYTLGKQYLGLNSLFTAILSVLALSELGIGSALVFNMYEPIAKGDDEKVCKLLNAYKKFYRLIGIIVLVLGLLLMPFITYFINGSYPSNVNIYLLYFIYLINTVLTYTFFAYKSSILEACQDNSIESKLHFFISLIMYIFQILALLFTKNYYVFLIIMPLSTLLLNIIRSKYVDKNYSKYKCNGDLTKSELKEIFKNIKALIGHKIGTTVILSADSIVLSSFLGLDLVAMYSNYSMIMNSLIGLVSILYTSILASVGNTIVTENKSKLYNQFNELNFLNEWIVSWCTVCLFCLYQPFMVIWMGKDMMFGNSTVVLFCLYFYSRQIRRIGLTYKDAAGMWNEDFWKPYIGIVLNILGNILLVLWLGVNGIIISTILVMTLVYFPWETIIVHKKLFSVSSTNYVLKILFNFIITLAICILTKYICSFVIVDGIIGLIIIGVICLIIPNTIYLLLNLKNKHLKSLFNRVKMILHLS